VHGLDLHPRLFAELDRTEVPRCAGAEGREVQRLGLAAAQARGLTRAQLTLVINLPRLAAVIQEGVLLLEGLPRPEPVDEPEFRQISPQPGLGGRRGA